MRTLLPRVEELGRGKAGPGEQLDPPGGGVVQGVLTSGMAAPGAGRGHPQVQVTTRARQNNLTRGSLQRNPQQRRRRTSFMPHQAAPVEPMAPMAPSVAGIQGAAVQLPHIQDEAAENPKESSTDQPKVMLPTLPATYQRPGPGRVRPRQPDVQLVVGGQDLKLPPPRSQTQSRNKPISLKEGLAALEAVTTDASAAGGRQVLALSEDLKRVLLCHSIGVPLQIKKGKKRGRPELAMPLFHCKRCLAHWTNFGHLPAACDQPAKAVRGQQLKLSKNAMKFIKQLQQIQAKIGAGGANKLPAEEARKLKQLFRQLVTLPSGPTTTPDGSRHGGYEEDYSSSYDGDTSSCEGDMDLEGPLPGKRKHKGGRSRRSGTNHGDSYHEDSDFGDEDYDYASAEEEDEFDVGGTNRTGRRRGRGGRKKRHEEYYEDDGKVKRKSRGKPGRRTELQQDADYFGESYSSESTGHTDTEDLVVSDVSEGEIEKFLYSMDAHEQQRYRSMSPKEKLQYKEALVQKYNKTFRKIKARKLKKRGGRREQEDFLEESYSSDGSDIVDPEHIINSDISEGKMEQILGTMEPTEQERYRNLNSGEKRKYRKALVKKYKKKRREKARKSKKKKGSRKGSDYIDPEDIINSDISDAKMEQLLSNMDPDQQERYRNLNSGEKLKYRKALVNKYKKTREKKAKKSKKKKGSRKDGTACSGEEWLSDGEDGSGSDFILAGRNQDKSGSYDALIDTLVDAMDYGLEISGSDHDASWEALSGNKPRKHGKRLNKKQMNNGQDNDDGHTEQSSDDESEDYMFDDDAIYDSSGNIANFSDDTSNTRNHSLPRRCLNKIQRNQSPGGDSKSIHSPSKKSMKTKQGSGKSSKVQSNDRNTQDTDAGAEDGGNSKLKHKKKRGGPEATNGPAGGGGVTRRQSQVVNPGSTLYDAQQLPQQSVRQRKEKQKAPILNPAVKNKMGKPENQAGYLRNNGGSVPEGGGMLGLDIPEYTDSKNKPGKKQRKQDSPEKGSRMKSAANKPQAGGTQVQTLMLDQPDMPEGDLEPEGGMDENGLPRRKPSASIPNNRLPRQVIKKGQNGERRRPQAKAYHSKELGAEEAMVQPVEEEDAEPTKMRLSSAAPRPDPTMTGPNMRQSMKMSHGEQKKPLTKLQDTLPSGTTRPSSGAQMAKASPLPPIRKSSSGVVNKPVCVVESVQVVEARQSNEKLLEEVAVEVQEQSASEESSSSSESSDQETDGPDTPDPPIVIPAFGGMSVLSFSSATYSVFALPEQYRKHNEQIKSQSQTSGKHRKPKSKPKMEVRKLPDRSKERRRSSLSGLSRQVTQKIKNRIATKNMIRDLDTVIEEAASHRQMSTAAISSKKSALAKSSTRINSLDATTSAPPVLEHLELQEDHGADAPDWGARQLPSTFQGLHKGESIIIQVVDYPQMTTLDVEADDEDEA